jgi:glucose-1-phosphate thymidylyltransferase
MSMKGLILAGGAGTRLRPLTYTGAKQLVPVANRPMLFYVIDNLVAAGVRDIGIIVSPETGAEVRSAVGSGAAWGARVEYILQDRPAGLAHAVTTARGFLGHDDFCMFLGDNLIGQSIRGVVEEFEAAPDLAALILLKEVSDPRRFGVAEVGDDGRVIRLVEKPAEPRSNLALVGIYLLRAAIHEAIARIRPSARGELEITDALGMLIELGAEVRCERVTSWWLDTGKKDDLLLANDTVLDAWLVHEVKGSVDAESVLTGRVRVEAGATIVRSSIRGPAIIGEDARIVDARIGPYTAVGPGVVIERSRVDHSVIMEGSRILDIQRLEDSLIGRRVLVHPGDSGHGSLALFVGDDCRIELAQRR